MNKREAKLRAMKLSLYCMKEAFANNGVFDLVDEDTSNEEALQIADEAKAFIEAVKAFVLQENVEMVVVGPEDPLVLGI